MDNLKEIAKFILDEAKAAGVDYATCAVTENKVNELNIDTGEFSLYRTLFDKSVAISVNKDKKHGAVAANSFDKETLSQAVKDAVATAESAEPDDAWQIDDSGTVKEFVEGPLVCDDGKLFDRTKELVDDIHNGYPKLTVEEGMVTHVSAESVYMNTYGTTYESRRGAYSFSVGYAGHEGESSSHTYYSYCRMNDLDKPFIEYGLTKRQLAETEQQASPQAFGEKFVGTVVFAPSCAEDVVFGTIIGNFVSDRSLIEGTSVWKDKLGEKVADERISASLAPGDARIVMGQRFTGEGYLAEDYDLIKDGVLNSFCLSQYAANKVGLKRSANTSGALICKPGTKTIDEIISAIDKGILVGRFSGGQPGPNGEFSGIAKNAFMIEGGKITMALSETMISDNLTEMLFRLRDVSSDVLEDGGSSVPYYAFDGVTISGK